MVKLQLKRVLYKKINSLFESGDNGELQIETNFTTNVNYCKENKTCLATMTNHTVAKDHPELLDVSVEIIGIFVFEEIETEEDKREAHIQMYSFLFPYIQSIVADLSIKAGFPPLLLEMPCLELSEVNISE